MPAVRRTLSDIRPSGLAALLPQVVEVREVRDVVLERPVVADETVHVSVDVDAATPLADERELLSTTWRIANDAGETIVLAHADVVCRGRRREAADASSIGDVRDDVDIGQIPV